jgi:HK97 family phage major capsid protein
MSPEEIEVLKRDAAAAAVAQFRAEQGKAEQADYTAKNAAIAAIQEGARGARGAGLETLAAMHATKSGPERAPASAIRTKGVNPFGAYALAWAASGGAAPGAVGADREKMIGHLKAFGLGDRERTMQAGVFTAGGSGIPVEYATEFIDLLRPQLVLGALGAVMRPFNARVQIGRMNSGPTAQWLGEGQEITKSTPGTGAIVLTAHKLGVLVDVSNDILRNPLAGVDDVMLAKEMAAAVEFEDSGINGSGVSAEPMGLLTMMDQAQSFTKTVGGSTYITDVDKLVATVDATNRPREKRGWLMSTAVESALLGLRDDGGWWFRTEMLERGTLRGFPYRSSSLVPVTHLIFGEFADLIMGVSTAVELASSPGERFKYDETSFRLILGGDWALKRSTSFACINNY